MEWNGGGTGIADFNQVFNGGTYTGSNTLPAGGTWLVFTISRTIYTNSTGDSFDFSLSIHPGGYQYGDEDYSGDSRVLKRYMRAVRIA